MPRLTEKQWQKQKAPFCWIKLHAPPYWTQTHLEIVAKWLDANVSGWWHSDLYISGEERRVTLVFEKNADRILFKLWASDDPFVREGGEIEVAEG